MEQESKGVIALPTAGKERENSRGTEDRREGVLIYEWREVRERGGERVPGPL